MPYIVRRPVSIVEGHGDLEAVTGLLRRLAFHKDRYDFQPLNPAIRSGGLSRLKKQLERHIRLAALREGSDGIFIALDCEDDCAKEQSQILAQALLPLAKQLNRRIAISFFVREFEALFLHCLGDLHTQYPEMQVSLPCRVAPADVEHVRDAKGNLDAHLQGASYKETRDQSRFVHALNLDSLLTKSRSFRHFASCLEFFLDPQRGYVYPSFEG